MTMTTVLDTKTKTKEISQKFKALRNSAHSVKDIRSAQQALNLLEEIDDMRMMIMPDNKYDELKIISHNTTLFISDELNRLVQQSRIKLRIVARQVDFYKDRKKKQIIDEQERLSKLMHALIEISTVIELSDCIEERMEQICMHATQSTIRNLGMSVETINKVIKPVCNDGVDVQYFLENKLHSLN